MHNEAVYQAIEALDDVLRQLKKKKKKCYNLSALFILGIVGTPGYWLVFVRIAELEYITGSTVSMTTSSLFS
uniref:Uncharacterized protein n=1 Tax=Physcomitrium patens TaxID=3218 RepID=A0A2K1IG23_PHYPA|nr:hypothetical protein PHYPA_028818 [Physcomitrium patens]